MSARLENFRSNVEDGHDLWLSRVGLPYVMAYATAHDEYRRVMQAQADADRARAELFVMAASVVGGSVLMATLATSSLRVLAGRAALHTISKFNLDRLYQPFSQTAAYRGGMFAIGKLLDHAKGEVTKTAQAHVADLMQNTSTLVSSSPVVQHAQITKFLLDQKICANAVAGDIERDTRLSDADKDAAFAVLNESPIVKANAPRSPLNQTKLAEKIELSFYMTAVLDSDRLNQWGAYPWGASSPRQLTSQRSISQLPGASNYPRETRSTMGWTGMSSFQSVSVLALGDQVEKRIDALHRTIFGTLFYPERGAPNEKREAGLMKAQSTLNDLARTSRPQFLSEVRV